MKVGILSDTHGNISSTRRAAKVFKKAGVEAIFHCGDIGSFDVLAALKGIPVHAVFGNVDHGSADRKYMPTNSGVQLYGRFGSIEIEGKRIALLHSDDRPRFESVISSNDYDFVLSGHSHTIHDYRKGNTRCINPGTAGRGVPNTCAILDITSGALSIIEL